MSEFRRPDEKSINPENVWEDDAFRSLGKYAAFLTKALTANKKNFVLNVNGPWGTGKSFFVQRWAADLRKHYPVIEYNAWENDSEDDPLSSLLAVCAEGLKEHFSDKQNLIDDLKKKGGRIALRLGSLVAKAGLRKIFGDGGVKEICDIYSESTENDLIDLGGTLVEEQIKKQQERKSFVEELEKLVAKLDADNKLPVFIFIDELDRCRPTFAIELLERVKHLFGVSGLKFIISTDTKQLIHSISGVYGDRFDGCAYLQRFFDETFTLPSPDNHQFAKVLLQEVDSTQTTWSENKWLLTKSPSFTLGELSSQFKLTLREQYSAYHRIMMVIKNLPIASINNRLHFAYICILVILRIKCPDDYHRLMTYQGKTQIWSKVKGERRISITNIPIVDCYFEIIESEKELIGKISDDLRSAQNTPSRDYQTRESFFYVYRSCWTNYEMFVKYPQVIELAETLSQIN